MTTVYGMGYKDLPWGSFVAWTKPRLKRPSEKLLISDAVDWIVKEAAWNVYQDENTVGGQAIAPRHDGRTNVLFFDGHVETLPRTELRANALIWHPFRNI